MTEEFAQLVSIFLMMGRCHLLDLNLVESALLRLPSSNGSKTLPKNFHER